MSECISESKTGLTNQQTSSVFCQLVDLNGVSIGSVTRINLHSNHSDLQCLYQSFNESCYQTNQVCFYINERIVDQTIAAILSYCAPENVVRIRVEPIKQAEPTSPVCRCTTTLSGHKECILVVRFNSQSTQLATGGGDGDIRIWDMTCDTPLKTLTGNGGWITCLSWSFDCVSIVGGSRSGLVTLWNIPEESCLKMDKHCPHWVSCVVFNPSYNEIASGSKDMTIKIWSNGKNRLTLAGHQGPVTSLRDWIVSGSHDRTLKLWNTVDGSLIRQVCHSHWINSICYHQQKECYIVASASDDFTIGLWNLSDNTDNNKLVKLTGHCQPVVDLKFSPDGTMLASCSFDKSVKLWSSSGKFICTFLGHVGRVYQLAWSPDSRYIVSASADSTVKLWSVKSKKLRVDLPGHADEVYALDWSKDGHIVATGGKDRNLKTSSKDEANNIRTNLFEITKSEEVEEHYQEELKRLANNIRTNLFEITKSEEVSVMLS
ncbi:hypothetical protein GJ496_010405 [Pomphorhynchus laevis]|nr:hypothetical protein GJ496_010405 [Pomphorhynchus laevis]